MRSRFPQFRVKQKGRYDITFTGDLHVKDIYPVYTLSIHYQGDLYPSVKILRPTLVDKPPHFYRKENEPCLYKPKNYAWNRTKLIATDIVPWTAGWIYFYETWLRTGDWLGPEAEHDEPTEK